MKCDSESPWRRAWIPSEYAVPLDPKGFLERAATRFDVSPNYRTFELAELRAVPCAVLLGEAGSGKTFALAAEKDALTRAGMSVRLVDLAAVADERGFLARLGTLGPVAGEGRNPVHVLLDGLDECPVGPAQLGRWVGEWLEASGADGADEAEDGPRRVALHLRIAARPGVWRTLDMLPKRLARAFGEGMRSYELCPLTVEQARERAVACLADADEAERFLAAVHETDTGPFAARPVTLNLLLRLWRARPKLPETRRELYEAGLRELCKHPDDRSVLGADDRLAICRRIAGLSVLTGRPMLDDSPAQAGVLSFGAICADGTTCSALTDVLTTGVFGASGERRLTWAHWSYAEFLAASYVLSKTTPKRRAPSVWSLLTAGTGESATLAPQLEGVAGWLAAQDSRLFARVLERQPEVLLRGDPRSLSDRQRVALAHRILERIEGGEALARGPGAPSSFFGMAADGLGELLEREWIRNRDRSGQAREVAVRMARHAGAKELVVLLCDVALDATEPAEVRKEALLAVHELGDEGVKRRLVPLATRSDPTLDRDEELRGLALLATWPGLIPEAERFSVLAEPRERTLFGQYRAFLAWVLPRQLKERPELLIPALGWVEAFAPQHDDTGYPPELLTTLLRLAWDRASDPAVRGVLARTLLARMAHYERHERAFAPNGWTEADDDARRALLVALVAHLAKPDETRDQHVHDLWPYVTERDVDWARTQQGAASSWVEPTWSQLVKMAMALGAPRPQPPVTERVAAEPEPFSAWLARQEAAGADLWQRAGWKLIHDTQLNTLADLVELGAWKDLDVPAQDRLRTSALAYAVNELPAVEPQNWHATTKMPVRDALGVWALTLVQAVSPELLHLPEEVWCRWGPAIALCHVSRETEPPRLARLLEVAFAACPAPVEAAYLDQLLGEDERARGAGGSPQRSLPMCFDALRPRPRHRAASAAAPSVWSAALADALHAWARERGADSPLLVDVLDILLQHDHQPTRELVMSWLDARGDADDVAAGRAVIAGDALARSQPSPRDAWTLLWPYIETARTPVGLEILSGVVGLDGRVPGLQLALDEATAAVVFLWLNERLPAPRRSRRSLRPFDTPDQLRMWMDGLVTQLVTRASDAALEALRRIVKALPAEEWPRWRLLEAERRYRATSWTWPTPKEVDDLLS